MECCLDSAYIFGKHEAAAAANSTANNDPQEDEAGRAGAGLRSLRDKSLAQSRSPQENISIHSAHRDCGVIATRYAPLRCWIAAMMKFIAIISCFTVASTFAQGTLSLKDTKWIARISETCVDTVTFKKNSTYIEYGCELNEHRWGTYRFSRDTLYLFQERGEYDNEDSTEHAGGKALFKYVLEGGGLKLVYAQPDLHRPPVKTFDPGLVLRRVKR